METINNLYEQPCKKIVDETRAELPNIKDYQDSRIMVKCEPFKIIAGLYEIAITGVNPFAKLYSNGPLCSINAIVFEKRFSVKNELTWSAVEFVPEEK